MDESQGQTASTGVNRGMTGDMVKRNESEMNFERKAESNEKNVRHLLCTLSVLHDYDYLSLYVGDTLAAPMIYPTALLGSHSIHPKS